MTIDDLTAAIRRARGRFIAMAATYSLGVFNDSFFRQSAMLLAIGCGMKYMPGWIMAVFTVPYLLFASPAGWLADRFSKRHVVIGAKLLELLAMLLGAVGICAGNWWLIMAMVFVMGMQSCLFGPALNGSIPELYPASYVTKANAILKIAVTAAILLGVSAAGLALSFHGDGWAGISIGRLAVAAGAVAISLLGVAGSFGVPDRPAADPHVKFPWSGPLHTLRELALIRRDRLLAIVVSANVFLWFAGAMLIPLINLLAMKQFGCGEDIAGYMVAAEMVGVAAGGALGSMTAKGARWYRLFPFAIGGMGVSLLAVAALPLAPAAMRLPAAFLLLAVTGVFGGAVLIPCEAFVQMRPASNRKGAVIAATNFAVFSGIMLSGPAANATVTALEAGSAMGLLGAAAVIAGLWLRLALAGVREAGVD